MVNLSRFFALPFLFLLERLTWRDGIGIAIFPPTTVDGVVSKESLGVSSKAGEIAISQTAASRVLTNMLVASLICGMNVDKQDC